MSYCKYIYDNIIRIEFFKDDPSVISFSKPFVVYDPLITVSTDTTATNVDCIIKSPAEFEALIDDLSGSLVVDETTSVAGSKFKNTIEYDLEWVYKETDNSSYKNQLVNLQQHNYHMRVSYLGGAQQIIRTDESSWSFDYKESKGKPHITIVAENISGAQRVV